MKMWDSGYKKRGQDETGRDRIVGKRKTKNRWSEKRK